MSHKEQIADLIKKIQHDICHALTSLTGDHFSEDQWERERGGGGITKICNGKILEKAGVNSSEVSGVLTDQEKPMFNGMLASAGIDTTTFSPESFYATGVSLVIHPMNPYIPTTHANYRYFEVTGSKQVYWWFGGGADLTPYYLDTEDATHFHHVHKTACDQTDPSYYPRFKKACDQYFYLPHRQESRGIGGIFFDYLRDKDSDTLSAFIENCGASFIPAYSPMIQKHRDKNYGDREKNWQKIRRGRYVEFNLIYDRGTLFGLKTNGRTESILMSLPPEVTWAYDHKPAPHTDEAKLLDVIRSPRDWV